MRVHTLKLRDLYPVDAVAVWTINETYVYKYVRESTQQKDREF